MGQGTGGVEGESSGASFDFINLMAPNKQLTEGLLTQVKNAQGQIIDGSTSSISDIVTIAETNTNMLNIASKLGIEGSISTRIDNQLNTVTHDNPELPIIGNLVEISQEVIQEGGNTGSIEGQAASQGSAVYKAQKYVQPGSQHYENVKRFATEATKNKETAQTSLEEAKTAAAADDLDATQQAANKANEAAIKAESFYHEASDTAKKAIGTPYERSSKALVAQAKEDAEKARSIANEANTVCTDLQNEILAEQQLQQEILNQKGEAALQEGNSALDGANTNLRAAKDALAHCKAAAGNQNVEAADKYAKDARTAADAATSAANAAQEAAIKAVGTPSEQAAKDLAVKASLVAVDAMAVAVEAEMATQKAVNVEKTQLAQGNPFLASNPFVAFMVNFMEMTRMLMQNKRVEGTIQINTIDLIMAYAEDTKSQIMRAAKLQQKNYITAAICAGVAMVGTGVGLGMSLYGLAGAKQPLNKPPPQKPEVPPFTAQQPAIPNPPTTFRPGNPPQPTNANGLTQREIHSANLGADQANLARARMIETNNPNLHVANDGTITNRNTGVRVTEAELNSDIKLQNETAQAKVDESNKAIEKRNDARSETLRSVGQGIGQVVKSATDMIENAVKAATELDKAQAEAAKTMLEAYRQMAQQLLSSVNDSFRADGDKIKDLIQQLDGIKRSLNEAVASMLRK